jgi:hypothetical protein
MAVGCQPAADVIYAPDEPEPQARGTWLETDYMGLDGEGVADGLLLLAQDFLVSHGHPSASCANSARLAHDARHGPASVCPKHPTRPVGCPAASSSTFRK